MGAIADAWRASAGAPPRDARLSPRASATAGGTAIAPAERGRSAPDTPRPAASIRRSNAASSARASSARRLGRRPEPVPAPAEEGFFLGSSPASAPHASPRRASARRLHDVRAFKTAYAELGYLRRLAAAGRHGGTVPDQHAPARRGPRPDPSRVEHDRRPVPGARSPPQGRPTPDSATSRTWG